MDKKKEVLCILCDEMVDYYKPHRPVCKFRKRKEEMKKKLQTNVSAYK